MSEWLFPDTFCGKGKEREIDRPKSIDDAVRARDEEDEAEGDVEMVEEGHAERDRAIIERGGAGKVSEAQRTHKDESPEGVVKEEWGRERRRLNEIWRYDVDRGGALGIGMGMGEDEDRVIIDDLDPK